MNMAEKQVQQVAQAGSPGKAALVGSEVGGVHSNDEGSWLDLWALNPETRAYLKATAQGTLLVRRRCRGAKEREMARQR